MPLGYKRFTRSRGERQAILRAFNWLPDRVMVPLQYRIKTGRWPKLKNPQRFTEKIQWLKLNYRDSLMTKCADKVEVRNYVEECGFKELLVPLLGAWAHPEDIDYKELPSSFVLKDSLGGGGNEVLICRDKDRFDWFRALQVMRMWTISGRHKKHPGREWVYDREGSSLILGEELLIADDKNKGIMEYKFFCSYGKASYLYVLGNRDLGKGVELCILAAKDFARVNAWRADEGRFEQPIQRPAHYLEMLRVAEELSKPFPEVRVDFYYLGEAQGFRFVS